MNKLKLIRNILCYDIRNSWKKYWVYIVVLSCVLFISSMQLNNNYLFHKEYSEYFMNGWNGEEILTWADYIFNAFKGTKIITGDFSIFKIDITYLLIHIIILYITISFPFKDFNSIGEFILIKSGNRCIWYLSKCIWIIIFIIIVYSFLYLSLFCFCIIMHGSVSLETTYNLGIILELAEYTPININIGLIIQPILIDISISFFQLMLFLFLKVILTLIITIFTFTISIFVCNPIFIGNYSMFIRQFEFLNNSITTTNCILLSTVVSIISFIVGIVSFQKYDWQKYS